MQNPGYAPIKTDRYAPFAATLVFTGLDLTGRNLSMQVRPTPNDTGTPLATLGIVTDYYATGISRQGVVFDAMNVPTSTLRLSITEATIRSMPAASGLTGTALTDDDDLIFAYDIKLSGFDGIDAVALYGPFVLRAGVTQ